jgi:REP element-mobilizing transposase RayT
MMNENISRIIRWYKGRCSFEIRKIDSDFAWQSRFYDHIIRDEASFQKISNYIINNPANWQEDTFFNE